MQMGDCPMWNKNKIIESLEYCGCDKKMMCNKCHGWYENKYHPDNLKTNPEGEEEKHNRGSPPQKYVEPTRKEVSNMSSRMDSALAPPSTASKRRKTQNPPTRRLIKLRRRARSAK